MTKPSEMEAGSCEPSRWAGAPLDPVTQGTHPLVQVQKLSKKGTDYHGQNGDQGIAALQAPVDADIEDAQGDALHDDGLEPVAQEAGAIHGAGAAAGQGLNEEPCGGTGQDGQCIDDGTCQHGFTSLSL